MFALRSPRRAQSRSFVRLLAAAAAALPLAACDTVVLNPSGDIARQEADLLMVSTGLMLVIILPVMLLTVFFAWKYRQSNTEARYEPDWDHSTKIELVVWAAPLLIIICLGALTWVGTHLLDPWRPISRIDKNTPVTAAMKPLEVNVVALNWKWLFIYPELGIATVNELVVPTDRPLNFRISSSSMMNSFYVPAMAGQIYAMPGMETKLHAVMNEPTASKGFSANYSGSGFSYMRFGFRSVPDQQFAQWVDKVKASGGAALDRAAYLKLEQPTEKEPVRYYPNVSTGLFAAVVDMCVQPGKMCMSEMAYIDAQGGLGMAGVHNVAMLTYDKYGRAQSFDARDTSDKALSVAYVKALCSQPGLLETARAGSAKGEAGLSPIEGDAKKRSATEISLADRATPAS
ncbi:MAG: ubiquinol oxidase subunit II [Sphingomonadales bacterium]|nr:MAG: ubiquinol oxidase subunit II [Sphingomonadales bacterium]TNF02395.1 MAG: ubiquinol oxidase subunit II [Sphingomonadales bacterium]